MSVSVIIPTFRRLALLSKAIESVLSQEIDQPMEVIVFDDDQDRSAYSVVKSFMKNNSSRVEIKYLSRSHPKGGASLARNRSLDVASGYWIMFLDDDDTLCPDGLKTLIETAQKADADFCYGSYRTATQYLDPYAMVQEYHDLSDANYDNLRISNFIPVGSYIIKRLAILSRFNINLASHEDWLFLLDNSMDVPRAYANHCIVEIRRLPPDNINSRNNGITPHQKACDYATIYALHPSPTSIPRRTQIVQSFGLFTVEEFLAREPLGLPFVKHGPAGEQMLIVLPQETVQASLVTTGYFERHASLLASAIVKLNNGAVIDVGAHIGAFSVPVARENPTCTVYAFEPQRMIHAHLQANILLNACGNIVSRRAAVGAKRSSTKIRIPMFDPHQEMFTGSLSLDEEIIALRSIIQGVEEPWHRATCFDEVDMVCLDQEVVGLPVVFIKIDVEGMELKVLKGARKIIRKYRPVLYFEVWKMESFQSQRSKLLSFVRGLGYFTVEICEDCFAFHPSVYDPLHIKTILADAGIMVAN